MRNITFEHSDFLTSHPPADNDLIVAIRCFEYFEDKEGALEKMRDLLTRDGRIVIITKNADLVTSSSVQHKTLHSDQVSRRDMQHLAIKAGLVIEKIYPAVIRWKASYNNAFSIRFFTQNDDMVAGDNHYSVLGNLRNGELCLHIPHTEIETIIIKI